MKKTMSVLTAAAALSGTLSGLGAAPFPNQTQAATLSEDTNQSADELVKDLYNTAYKGEMPKQAQGLVINKSTKGDVHAALGEPERPIAGDNRFELYRWNMGQPGYGFSYHQDMTISEIRYFGTGVERQQNVGGVTPEVLRNELGRANRVLTVPFTDEIDYVYDTGQYELHFVMGTDQAADHVNLKAK
ncbi:YjgB family protein [Bacillus vallismortis]|uniref:YjgB family protein n=1 Tax=Bacillus vallismortis TaxID=72361 RepID=A0AAP3FSH3_BACVA|nr:YjgB family protein [Bacillus vallismortis]MCY8318443.1 YjgB family protein [Bacillus vallismortis]MCY8545364.1 YjgB family protein [Bacillus vallismortis]